jgi:hypothetical protein
VRSSRYLRRSLRWRTESRPPQADEDWEIPWRLPDRSSPLRPSDSPDDGSGHLPPLPAPLMKRVQATSEIGVACHRRQPAAEADRVGRYRTGPSHLHQCRRSLGLETVTRLTCRARLPPGPDALCLRAQNARPRKPDGQRQHLGAQGDETAPIRGLVLGSAGGQTALPRIRANRLTVSGSEVREGLAVTYHGEAGEEGSS